MRRISLEQINIAIESERKNVNQTIAEHLRRRRKRYRVRSEGEREALNRIAITRWQKAVENGWIKIINDRVLYYDYRKI